MRLSQNLAQPCLDRLKEIDELSSTGRRAYIAQLIKELFSPIPAHIERVHPSWVQGLLDEESPAVVAVAIQGLPAALIPELRLPPAPDPAPNPPPQVRRRVYELVLGRLARMAPEDEGEPRRLESWEELAAWDAARLEGALIRLGCLVLGSLIAKSGPAQAETLARQESLVSRFGAFAAEIKAAQQDPIPLTRSLTPLDLDHQDPLLALMRLGMQSVGPSIPLPWRVQAAQLLPRAEGCMLLAEGPGKQPIPELAATMLSCLDRADEQARQAQGRTRGEISP